MGKPEIIGYQHDPDNWSAPQLPEMTFAGGEIWVYRGGTPVRRIEPHELDGFMRYHGYKRVYRERQFHAWPAFGGYRLRCKECDRTGLIGGDVLPHDYASKHQCTPRYGTAEIVQCGSTIGAHTASSASLAVQLPDDDDLPCTHEITWMGSCVACSHEVDEW
jgi:hypothetical protein